MVFSDGNEIKLYKLFIALYNRLIKLINRVKRAIKVKFGPTPLKYSI